MPIKLADALPAKPSRMWELCRQLGVEHAVTSVPDGPEHPPPWDYDHLFQIRQRFADAGFQLSVIESAPASIQEPIKLGAPDRDRHIDHFCQLLQNMGRLQIPVMCHNWMAGLSWQRTSFGLRGRGGALRRHGGDPDVSTDPGMSDAAVRKATDRDWKEWRAHFRSALDSLARAGLPVPDSAPRAARPQPQPTQPAPRRARVRRDTARTGATTTAVPVRPAEPPPVPRRR
jgi:hypothetical protein